MCNYPLVESEERMRSQEDIEKMICEQLVALTDVFTGDVVDATMTFNSFGLDSLSKLSVLAILEKKLGASLAIEFLVDAETPRQLASLMYADIAGAHVNEPEA
jgi:acyl carrier protein